jgi:hypothetical protein
MRHRWSGTANGRSKHSEEKQTQCYFVQHNSYKTGPWRRDTPEPAMARPLNKEKLWNFHLKRIRISARGSGKFVINDLENLPYQIYSSVTKEER